MDCNYWDISCIIFRHRTIYIIGITSIELARTSLNIREAFAMGQIITGVPVWRLGAEARWLDISYVVSPGNMGDDSALLRVVTILGGA